MRKILHIVKPDETSKDSFTDSLERILTSIGLENAGRIGRETQDLKFPPLYVFESQGEGGFVLDYSKKIVHSDDSRTGTMKVDLTVIPVGAAGSLVHITYAHLQKESQKLGYECFERRIKD